MKRFVWTAGLLGLLVYVSVCASLYYFQESIIFHPIRLTENYKFDFKTDYEEYFYEVEQGISINALLFKSSASETKGLIFYLHGNARSIKENSWIHEFYNERGYDFLILDYRGYGKSGGRNKNQEQMMSDIRMAYEDMKSRYDESDIIIQGYSLGTGPATLLAKEQNPSGLILLAPYYSLEYMAMNRYWFIPKFILKYPFRTDQNIADLDIPIYIFHGESDKLITSDQAEMLLRINPENVELKLIDNCGHRGVLGHAETRFLLHQIL